MRLNQQPNHKLLMRQLLNIRRELSVYKERLGNNKTVSKRDAKSIKTLIIRAHKLRSRLEHYGYKTDTPSLQSNTKEVRPLGIKLGWRTGGVGVIGMSNQRKLWA
jgi:hypothetical protein